MWGEKKSDKSANVFGKTKGDQIKGAMARCRIRLRWLRSVGASGRSGGSFERNGIPQLTNIEGKEDSTCTVLG